MSRNNQTRVKVKKDQKIEPLFIRWRQEPYRTILKKIKDEKQLSRKTPKYEEKYDLRYIYLKRTRLSDISLSNSCLDSVCAYNLYLEKCNISNSIIHNGDFEEANLIDTNLSQTEFISNIFRNVSFNNVSMIQSSFIKCDFSGATFKEINVENAIFDDSNFCYLKKPEEIKIIGKPKFLREVLIDRYTLLMLGDSEFKKELSKNSKVLNNTFDKQYDVALSFAGEQRDYVEKLAKHLRDNGIRVFYDRYETHELWGKELITHLTELYGKKCNYVIVFASKDYATKGWTNVERVAFLSRILVGEYDCILPVKMDDTFIQGLTDGKGYIDGKNYTPEKIGELFIKKMTAELRK